MTSLRELLPVRSVTGSRPIMAASPEQADSVGWFVGLTARERCTTPVGEGHIAVFLRRVLVSAS